MTKVEIFCFCFVIIIALVALVHGIIFGALAGMFIGTGVLILALTLLFLRIFKK